jgi:hypothetical protein
MVCCTQAAAVRPILSGPPYGNNTDVDRAYVVARVKKALAGPAGIPTQPTATGRSTAAPGAHGDTVLSPWQSGADAAAVAVRLERVLAACDLLGPTADWVR